MKIASRLALSAAVLAVVLTGCASMAEREDAYLAAVQERWAAVGGVSQDVNDVWKDSEILAMGHEVCDAGATAGSLARAASAKTPWLPDREPGGYQIFIVDQAKSELC